MTQAAQTSLKPPADGFVSQYPDNYFDAILVLSFGGPEGMDDVIPFLENVTRGRNIPRERLAEVGEHYRMFDGVSPLNAQNRALIAALREELDAHGIDLPIYFGNRNWHPLLTDTLAQMTADGVKRVLAFFTSAYSSYSGCRQYRENLYEAQQAIGPDAPEVLKMRMFYNHPGFVEPNIAFVQEALA
jgi:protoporphyrin/coproporphyrin ferrochelatase